MHVCISITLRHSTGTIDTYTDIVYIVMLTHAIFEEGKWNGSSLPAIMQEHEYTPKKRPQKREWQNKEKVID